MTVWVLVACVLDEQRARAKRRAAARLAVYRRAVRHRRYVRTVSPVAAAVLLDSYAAEAAAVAETLARWRNEAVLKLLGG